MALDITVNLTDEREAELVKLTDEHNSAIGDGLTPSQFLRRFIRNWLDASAAQRTDTERLGMRAAYKLATPAEQAQIDAILNQYR